MYNYKYKKKFHLNKYPIVLIICKTHMPAKRYKIYAKIDQPMLSSQTPTPTEIIAQIIEYIKVKFMAPLLKQYTLYFELI